MALSQLKAAVLNLPEQERAEMALELLRSLHSKGPGTPVDSDAAWIGAWRDEAIARDQELGEEATGSSDASDAIHEARRAVAERKRANIR